VLLKTKHKKKHPKTKQQKMDSHVTQPALDVYNSVFGTYLSGDVEGNLHVKIVGGSLTILSSGDVVILELDGKSLFYSTHCLDQLKNKISS
jgi:hypothetical protein